MWAFFLFTMLNANSFETIKMDCDAGDAKACLKAGEIYSAQVYNTKKISKNDVSFQVALLYKKSCMLGDAEGCRAYAMHYTADKEKNPSKDAKYYFKKACDMGDFTSCTMLKMMP